MWDSLVAYLDSEMAVYLGTGLGAMVGAGYIAVRAIIKGARPASASVAAALAQNACGAPEVTSLAREILRTQRELHDDVEKVHDLVTRIEDRTR